LLKKLIHLSLTAYFCSQFSPVRSDSGPQLPHIVLNLDKKSFLTFLPSSALRFLMYQVNVHALPFFLIRLLLNFLPTPLSNFLVQELTPSFFEPFLKNLFSANFIILPTFLIAFFSIYFPAACSISSPIASAFSNPTVIFFFAISAAFVISPPATAAFCTDSAPALCATSTSAASIALGIL